MFKRNTMSLFDAMKSIVLNQRGSIGEEEVSEPAAEESAEESLEAESESEPESEGLEESPESEEPESIKADNEQELEAEIKDAIEDGASEEEVKDMIRQYTMKVDGKEIIKEIDLNDEDAVLRELQLAHKGQKSTQELQELKKLYTSELQRLQKDPFKVLKELDQDFDPLKLSADYIEQAFQESEMSPEEKAAQERELEFKKVLEERDRLKAAADKKEQDAKDAEIALELENDIMSALEEDSELIADKETVGLIAKELYWAMSNGYDMSAKDVIPTVKDQLRQQFRRSADRFKSTAIMKDYMGEELLGKLRDERVKQAQKQVKSVNNISKDMAKKESSDKNRKKVNLSSLFK